MKKKPLHLLIYLYSRRWRDRYGEELEELLVDEGSSVRTLLNVGWAALKEHFVPTQALTGGECSLSFSAVAKKPSAIIPMGMSLAALGVGLMHIAIAGIVPQGDEGAAAHIWQLLMAAQMPVLFFFAIKWLPRAHREALYVMGLQATAFAASMAPVFLLRW